MSKVLSAFFLVFFTVTATADDKSALVGVWQFAGEVDTTADGSPAPESAVSITQGLLIYTADGYMSAVLMPKERTWLAQSATRAQLRETAENGTAYAGRYEVDQTTHTITHVISVCMEPVYEGKRLVRQYSLDGNTLKLTGSYIYEGQDIHFTITWTRTAPQ